MRKDKYVFSSSYKEIMIEYIDFRKKLYCNNNVRIYLIMLDRYVISNPPKDNELSKEYIEKWLKKRENESNNTLYQRAVLIKDFAIYLNQHGIKAHIINMRNYKYIQEFIPHIYTNEEVHEIFESLNKTIIPTKLNPHKKEMYDLLFTIIHCCGLRISEALHIKWKNINIENQYIEILKSKNYMNRIVVINQFICNKILSYQSLFANSSSEDFVFPNRYKKVIRRQTIENNFQKIIKNSNLNQNYRYRIHDFRHTFAVNNLRKCFLNKEDINVKLPILMTYMGHQHISSTEYYLHFIADMYPEFIKECEHYFSNLIPTMEELEHE